MGSENPFLFPATQLKQYFDSYLLKFDHHLLQVHNKFVHTVFITNKHDSSTNIRLTQYENLTSYLINLLYIPFSLTSINSNLTYFTHKKNISVLDSLQANLLVYVQSGTQTTEQPQSYMRMCLVDCVYILSVCTECCIQKSAVIELSICCFYL